MRLVPARNAAQARKIAIKGPKEDHFAAILAKKVLPQFHFALIEAKLVIVAA